MHERNAKIDSTRLGPEGHGIFTAYVHLDYGGSGQGFGGYDLRPDGEAFKWIDGIRKVLGVRTWEDLPGTHCRVRQDKPFGSVISIGHIIEDNWFTP